MEFIIDIPGDLEELSLVKTIVNSKMSAEFNWLRVGLKMATPDLRGLFFRWKTATVDVDNAIQAEIDSLNNFIRGSFADFHKRGILKLSGVNDDDASR